MVTLCTLCLWKSESVAINYNPHKGTRYIETVWFCSGFAVWQQTLPCLPGQNIRCWHSTVSFHTEFYFPLSSLLVCKSHKSMCSYIVSDSSVGSVSAYRAGRWGSIPSEVIFLITMSIVASEAVKFHLFSNSLHLFILFLPLFTFEDVRSVVCFSMWNAENKQFPFKASCRLGPRFQKEIQNQTRYMEDQVKYSFHLCFAMGAWAHVSEKPLTFIRVFLQIRQRYWCICLIDIWHK
jgi:hypothetical protein